MKKEYAIFLVLIGSWIAITGVIINFAVDATGGIITTLIGVVVLCIGVFPIKKNMEEQAQIKASNNSLISVVHTVLKDLRLSEISTEVKKKIEDDSVDFIKVLTVDEYRKYRGTFFSPLNTHCCVTDATQLCCIIHAIILYHHKDIQRCLFMAAKEENLQEINVRAAKLHCFKYIYKLLSDEDFSSLDTQNATFKEELKRIAKLSAPTTHINPKFPKKDEDSNTSHNNTDLLKFRELFLSQDSKYNATPINHSIDFNATFSQKSEEKLCSLIKSILDIVIRNISDMDESSFPELSEAAFEVEDFGVIKQKATARLDYAIYIFFNLYCSLGTPNNEEFMMKFAEMYEKILKERFSNEIQSASLLNAVFDSRLISYDSIMRTSEDKDGDLIYQITQFIAKDLWLNEPLSKEWYIAGITKEFSLKMEITLLYRLIFDEIKPLYKELVNLSSGQENPQ